MVYVFLANGFEEVEALTPVDYLRRCELDVKTVGIQGKMVRGSHGITLIADMTFYDVNLEEAQMIVLPGGLPGTTNLEGSRRLHEVIDYCVEKEIPVGAICAAPSILGHKGLLKGRTATCASGFEQELEGANVTGAPVEVDGNFITARGAGVANEFAFALVERLCGKERTEKLKGAVRWEK